MDVPRFTEPSPAPQPNKRRLLPGLMLTVPFFALLAFVLVLILRSRFSERLSDVGQSERLQLEQFAIDKTPKSSVELALSGLQRAAAERSPSESWAIEDLCRRGAVDPLSAEAAEFLARFEARWAPTAPR